MDKKHSCANCSSTDSRVSACPTYKHGMEAIGFSLEDEDASKIDHEDFMSEVIAKIFCNLEGQIKLDCPQVWDAVADIKHPRHEEALSETRRHAGTFEAQTRWFTGTQAQIGVTQGRRQIESEARREDKPQ